MKLSLLLRSYVPDIAFDQYRRPDQISQMPPLDWSKLRVDALIGQERCALRVPVEGDVSLLLRYKGKEAGVTSAAEIEDGHEWRILQVQGGKQKGFRVTQAMEWQRQFGDRWKKYALHPDAEVEHLTMPHEHQVTNISHADSYEGAQRSYAVVRHALGMRYSETLHCYIVDVRQGVQRTLADHMCQVACPEDIHS